MIAILMMMAGQGVQAYEDFSCAMQHELERQSAGADPEDCPVGHACCCQSHVHSVVILAEAPSFLFEAIASGNFFERDTAPHQGPTREVDYPPQLS